MVWATGVKPFPSNEETKGSNNVIEAKTTERFTTSAILNWATAPNTIPIPKLTITGLTTFTLSLFSLKIPTLSKIRFNNKITGR
ncbi:hypothetical protein D3C74_413760 [compost metagenome]